MNNCLLQSKNNYFTFLLVSSCLHFNKITSTSHLSRNYSWHKCDFNPSNMLVTGLSLATNYINRLQYITQHI